MASLTKLQISSHQPMCCSSSRDIHFHALTYALNSTRNNIPPCRHRPHSRTPNAAASSQGLKPSRPLPIAIYPAPARRESVKPPLYALARHHPLICQAHSALSGSRSCAHRSTGAAGVSCASVARLTASDLDRSLSTTPFSLLEGLPEEIYRYNSSPMSVSTTTALVEPLAMSHRRQPVRQARANPPRHAASARTLGGTAPDAIARVEEPPGFFPGITHFTDSIGALPKEMVRQFTMLKEVDAKVCRPEETLKKLVGELLQKPPVPRHQPLTYPVPVAKVVGRAPFVQSESPLQEEQFEPHRRELSYQLRMVLTNMNHTMDEKTHVMTAATDALQKLLARCESSWPQIESEISEETRIGNPNHRALDNEAAPEKKPSAVGERPRREAAMSNVHAGLGDDMRGTSRKGRAQQIDSDFDEPRPKAKAKNRKHELQNSVGLGIVNGAGPNKRRKVEKGAAGSAAMDRGSSLQGSHRNAHSHTPNSETVKKRARGNAMAGAVGGRKRAGTANSNTHSPGNASSPVMGNLASAPRGGHGGALGAAMQRTGSRARQGSATGSSMPGGTATKDANHSGSVEPTSHPKNGESKVPKTEDGSADRSGRSAERSTTKKEDSKHRPPAISTVARHNGRASKHNTPVASTFPSEATRPRSGRTVNPPASFSAENPPAPAKRSHKKGAGLAAQQQKAAEAAIARAAEVDEVEDEEPDENEPTYCYCGGVSYGEMVACDGPHCEREWFHLDCAGLSKAPKGNEKWFCRDCQPKPAKAR